MTKDIFTILCVYRVSLCDIKVKLKFTLEQDTKAQRGSRGKLYSFFNLGVKRGWVVNAMLPPGNIPGTHCTAGWVGPRAGMDL
jgi:hypothetical protein